MRELLNLPRSTRLEYYNEVIDKWQWFAYGACEWKFIFKLQLNSHKYNHYLCSDNQRSYAMYRIPKNNSVKQTGEKDAK